MKISSMASSSSSSSLAFYYRQTEPKSVTGYHHTPPDHNHRIVIEMGSTNIAGAEADDRTRPGFSANVDCSTLSELVKEKSLDGLANLGGVRGIITSLKTDAVNGIDGNLEEISRRIEAFGDNSYGKKPTKSFITFVWEASKDTTLIILLACASLSLGFGIKANGLRTGWYDGVSIFVAVFLVIFVSAASDFKQYRKFSKLSSANDNISVEVVRNGRRQKISIFEVVVGDIICLMIGSQVPADGLLITGYSLCLDESSMTGESDLVDVDGDRNPFLLSGTMVADGFGTMLVTSVGKNTTWGEMMRTISSDFEVETPLKARLNKLASCIGKAGLGVAFLVLAALFVRYFRGNKKENDGNIYGVINDMVGIIAATVTILVVAIPQGLPLAVTLTLAYSMRRMVADQAFVKNPSACEAMGYTTAICTDMTSTLLSDDHTDVTKSFIGKESMEGRSYTSIATNVLRLLVQGIIGAHNLFTITPTDVAIHTWAMMKLNVEIDDSITQGLSILNMKASCLKKKTLGFLVRRHSDNTIHAHWRGDFERILSSCSHYYDFTGNTILLDDHERERFRQAIKDSTSGLRCVAFSHKLILSEDATHNEIPDKNLILLGVVGLNGFCRPGIKQAVQSVRLSGIEVKMITTEDVSSAEATAIECGLIQKEQDELVVTGEEFRGYTEKERLEKAERVKIMARSSPLDKLLLVKCLQEKGHVVAVTVDGINDAPVLEEADIALSMGLRGTQLAREVSHVIILDDNFSTIPTLVRWGRCVHNNVLKFVQFQLTINVAALVITFVGSVSTGKAPLTPVQLLWVNLIMDTLGAIALATEKPNSRLMNRPPIRRHVPLITNVMWRNITGQATYQIAVTLALKFKVLNSIFGVQENAIDTLVFNTFVLLQIFNLLTARELEKKNVFEGIHKNKLFLGIIGIVVAIQVIMVEFLNKFAHTERLDLKQWGVCIAIAALSLPVGWLVKLIPVPKSDCLSLLPIHVVGDVSC